LRQTVRGTNRPGTSLPETKRPYTFQSRLILKKLFKLDQTIT